MTYNATVYSQDAGTGRVEQVLSALGTAAADADGYSHMDVAVAYASEAGVRLLDRHLNHAPSWGTAEKRFLISIDFGVTEPQALIRLAHFENAQVRVPNGRRILASRRLAPPRVFHPKAYLFRRDSWSSPSALVVGSANLTASALAVGSEVVIKQSWSGALDDADRRQLRGAAPYLPWYEDAWHTATPLTDIIEEYQGLYRTKPTPRGPFEENTPDARTYLEQNKETVDALAVQLENAKALWVRTDELYHNRGPGQPGNQLDTPRGTRSFFGFSAEQVPKNTVLGDVEIRVPGHLPTRRSVRFANNMMDKVNLPIPGTQGPENYDHKYLVFERSGLAVDGTPAFVLTITDRAGIDARIASAANSVPLTMGSGREYGLLF